MPLVSLPAVPADCPTPGRHWPSADLPDDVASRGLVDLVDAEFTGRATPSLATSLALVVVHRGRIVLERYGPDVDEQTPLISWSMAKSFVHALAGLAKLDGRLDLDEPAAVPEWAAPGDPRSTITTEQLLRMCPGLAFVEDYVDEGVSHCLEMLFGSGRHDMAHYAADLPLESEPGSSFNYSSGTTNIVARLLDGAFADRRSLVEVQQDRLLDPLGMSTATATVDDAGTFVGSSYVHASGRDFARFGLWYLRDGVWDGERLLPEGWVDHARTRTPLDTGEDRGVDYGAHWWLERDGRGTFYAGGYEGQRIMVVPANDLVVVRLGKTPIELAPNLVRFLEEVIACFDDLD